MADLFVAAAAQVVCSGGDETGGRGPRDLLWNARPVRGASQQVVQTPVGSIIGCWFQTQKI